jgi:ATP-binding cassette, subfamily C, bacterial LapB
MENNILTIELEQVQHKIKKSFDFDSDFVNLLLPLLIQLGWQKDIRNLFEALPHFSERLTVTEFRNLMINLGFKSEQKKCYLTQVSPQQLPCIFTHSNGQVILIQEIINNNSGKELVVLDGRTGSIKKLTIHQMFNLYGTLYCFSKIQQEDEFKAGNWFWFVVKSFKYIIGQIFIVNLLYNVLAISIPIFIMVIYDSIIPTESISMLFKFSLGIWIVLLFMYVISLCKNKMIAYMAARLDKTVAFTIIKHILELSPVYTENITLNNQLSSIKDFENVCEFFSSPIAMVLFELPVSFALLIVIMFMGGWIMTIPLILMIISFGIFIGTRSLIGELVKLQTQDGAMKQSFIMDSFSKIRWLKLNGAISVCINKFDDMLVNIAKYGFKAQVINHILLAVADGLMLFSAIMVMACGVLLSMDNNMSSGALIAIMLLTWKAIDPLKVFITSLPAIEQVTNSIKQINNLINLPKEVRRPDLIKVTNINFIELQRVSFRYAWQENPSLLGVSFNLEPGNITCLVGKHSSGKSTIIKLILALYHAQSGMIKINNMNINQIDPVFLRKTIGYMPQNTNLFFGTIKQNLLLANPLATQAEIKQASELAGVHDDILQLKFGYDTHLGDQSILRLSSSFIQKLVLARVYLKNSKILIFDNPCLLVDRIEEQKFLNTLQQLKKDKIILLATSKMAHLEIADQIIYLKSGQIVAAGHPSQVLSGILAEYGLKA